MNHTLPKAYDEERSERAWALLDRFLSDHLRRPPSPNLSP